ncbi:hypothetical protein [Chitinimonas lacunae]|uniref:Uncharacterized protein n=1 Tax=Chitinimonas lacunae TaxID=1963018 RepID=A0ABV8MYE9_9NEIS
MTELSPFDLELVSGGASAAGIPTLDAHAPIPIIGARVARGEEGPILGSRERCPEDDGPVLGSRDPVRIPVKGV